MNTEYYQKQDYKYLEVATALERFYYTSEGKFFINAITPLLSSSSPIDETKSKISTVNILNYDSKLNVSSYTVSNYVSLRVPRYIATEVTDEYGYINKGTKFIVSFIGGDINKPRILGVY